MAGFPMSRVVWLNVLVSLYGSSFPSDLGHVAHAETGQALVWVRF